MTITLQETLLQKVTDETGYKLYIYVIYLVIRYNIARLANEIIYGFETFRKPIGRALASKIHSFFFSNPYPFAAAAPFEVDEF